MAITGPGDARDEILTLFKAAWDAITPSPPTLVYTDNATDIPKDRSSWARVTVSHNFGEQTTMGEEGNRRFEHTGLVTVQIFTPFDDGLTEADSLAKVAVNAFEGKKTTSGDIWFRRVRSNEIGSDGEWFQTNVIAEFEYDKVK